MTSTYPGNAQALKEITARRKGNRGEASIPLRTSDAKDIETAFRAASKGQADAVLIMVVGFVVGGHRTKGCSHLAVKSRLPAIYNAARICRSRRTYDLTGANVSELDRRAATYVDKILKAQSPLIFRWSNRISSI